MDNNNRQVDTEIAEGIFGNEVKWWSLHWADSEASLEGREWRPALFTEFNFAKGEGAEVYLPDREGDMAAPYMKLGTGEWVPLPKYLDDDSYFTEIIEAVIEDGHYKFGVTYQRFLDDEKPSSVAGFFRVGEGLSILDLEAMWMSEAPTMHRAMCLSAVKLARSLQDEEVQSLQ